MEEIIIDTPLRTIVLAANNSRRQFNPLEEQSIEKYTGLHHAIHRLAERFSAWYSEAQIQRATLQALFLELGALEGQQKRFGPIAGYEPDVTGIHANSRSGSIFFMPPSKRSLTGTWTWRRSTNNTRLCLTISSKIAIKPFLMTGNRQK